MPLAWRTEDVAFGQWCPHVRVSEVEVVELECCHLPGAPNIQIRQELPAVSVNRYFDTLLAGELNLEDDGQGYANIGCIASLCSQWEVNPGPIPEGETKPLGRCGLPAQIFKTV